MWSKCPWVTSSRSQLLLRVGAGAGCSGCRTRGRTGSPCRRASATSTAGVAEPGERRVAPDRHRSLLPRAGGASSRSLAAHYRPSAPRRGHGYTRGRACPADRDEPRADQLDRAAGARGGVVRGRGRWPGSLTPATKGFLAFTAACAAGFGLLAYLSDTGLPRSWARRRPSPSTRRSTSRGALALVVFVVLAADHRRRDRPRAARRVPAIAGFAAGLSRPRAGGADLGRRRRWAAVPLAIQLLVLAAATGGVFAAMILGHWYLVTPKLPEAPLVMVSRRLLWIVALQVVLFVAWVGFGVGPGRGPRRRRAVRGAGGSVGAVRVAAADRRARVPARRLVGGAPDGHDAIDGVARPGCCTSTSGRSRPGRSSPRGCTSAPGCSCDGRRPGPAAPADPGPPVRDAARGGGDARAAARGPAGLDRRRRLDRGRRARCRRSPPAARRSGSRSTASTPTRTRPSPTATRSRASRRSAAAVDEAGGRRSSEHPRPSRFPHDLGRDAGRAARDRRGRRAS